MNETLIKLLQLVGLLKRKIKSIRSNVTFVLDELKKLTEAPENHRERTQKTFNDFENFLIDNAAAVKRFEGNFGKFCDAPNAELAQSIKDSLVSIDFKRPFFAMHELVGYLDQEKSMLFVLVAESAANIINAEGEFDQLRTSFITEIDTAVAEFGNWKGTPESLSVMCDTCGYTDCMSFHLVTPETNHPFYSDSGEARTGSLVVNHGAAIYSLGTDALKAARDAIQKRDVKALVAHLDGSNQYCSKCSKTFCKEHWTNIEVVLDEGFYDCTYATCPNGHRMMTDD